MGAPHRRRIWARLDKPQWALGGADVAASKRSRAKRRSKRLISAAFIPKSRWRPGELEQTSTRAPLRGPAAPPARPCGGRRLSHGCTLISTTERLSNGSHPARVDARKAAEARAVEASADANRSSADAVLAPVVTWRVHPSSVAVRVAWTRAAVVESDEKIGEGPPLLPAASAPPAPSAAPRALLLVHDHALGAAKGAGARVKRSARPAKRKTAAGASSTCAGREASGAGPEHRRLAPGWHRLQGGTGSRVAGSAGEAETGGRRRTRAEEREAAWDGQGRGDGAGERGHEGGSDQVSQ